MAKNNSARNEREVRSRYYACMLYPDNAYHCEYLQYLIDTQSGFYIIHDKGSDMYNVPYTGYVPEHTEDDGKAHIHCVLIFKNARTENGIIKSNPYVRYYKNAYSKQLFTLYDIPYMALPLEEVIRPVVEHFEALTDIYAYAEYLLHKDFKSVALGKRKYEISDIHMLNSDRSLLDNIYAIREMTDNECLETVRQLWNCSAGDMNTFLSLVQMYSNDKVLKYVQSHAYFINKYIIERNEVKVND